MAAAHQQSTNTTNFSPELSLSEKHRHKTSKKKGHQENLGGYPRVVVDDVDEDRLHPSTESGRFQKSKTEDEDNSAGWENPTARIKRIQVEAECRKMEFARLLEEHAQVIRTLKQMEEKELPHLIPNSVASVTKA